MRRIFYAVVLLGLLASVGAAAEPALLPDRIGPWLADGPAKNYSLKELPPNWIESSLDGHILHEAGLVRVENRTYKNGLFVFGCLVTPAAPTSYTRLCSIPG